MSASKRLLSVSFPDKSREPTFVCNEKSVAMRPCVKETKPSPLTLPMASSSPVSFFRAFPFSPSVIPRMPSLSICKSRIRDRMDSCSLFLRLLAVKGAVHLGFKT